MGVTWDGCRQSQFFKLCHRKWETDLIDFIFYIGSVTYSSAVSDPAFDFDTPLSSWLLAIFASDIDDCASSGAEEAVSLAFEGCESPSSSVRRVSTTAESPMTSGGFVPD